MVGNAFSVPGLVIIPGYSAFPPSMGSTLWAANNRFGDSNSKSYLVTAVSQAQWDSGPGTQHTYCPNPTFCSRFTVLIKGSAKEHQERMS